MCECCHREGADLRCGRCRESWYCSAACQKKHWKDGHKTKCVEFQKPTKAPRAAAAPAPAAAAAAPAPASAAPPSRSEAGGEECAICLDSMQQPQTLQCGHRFCHGCLASMRLHGIGIEQVCPLCRAPMPDADAKHDAGARLMAQYERWARQAKGGAPILPKSTPQPPWVRDLLASAAECFNEALAIDPGHAIAHCSLGYNLVRSGDSDGAEAAYRACLAACKEPHTFQTRSHACYSIGVLQRERGDEEGGMRSIFEALSHFKENGVALNQVAQYFQSRGDLVRAEAYFRAAIKANGENGDLEDGAMTVTSLGVVLGNKGDAKGAEDCFRLAIALKPNYSTAHSNLGCMLKQRGDSSGAAKSFAKACQIDPTDEVHKAQLAEQLRQMRNHVSEGAGREPVSEALVDAVAEELMQMRNRVFEGAGRAQEQVPVSEAVVDAMAEELMQLRNRVFEGVGRAPGAQELLGGGGGAAAGEHGDGGGHGRVARPDGRVAGGAQGGARGDGRAARDGGALEDGGRGGGESSKAQKSGKRGRGKKWKKKRAS